MKDSVQCKVQFMPDAMLQEPVLGFSECLSGCKTESGRKERR